MFYQIKGACVERMFVFFLFVFAVGARGELLFDCVNCTLYKRQENRDNCARSFEECGICLEGYQEVGVTQDTVRVKPCKKKDGCDFDKNCGDNQYCFHRHCVSCFNCLNLNRAPKSRCAKGPIECGSCLTGFHETAALKPCRQEKYAAYLTQNETTSMATVTTVSVISVTFLAVVIFAAFMYVVVKRRILDIRDEETSVREEIPIREPAMTRCPPPTYSEANEFGSCEEFTTFVSETKELVNEAICFRHPTAPYYPPSSYPEEEAGEAEVEPEVVNQANEFQPDDEEATIPSAWTPNASSSTNESSSELCTFSGLFPSSNTPEVGNATPDSATSNREITVDESQRSVVQSSANNTQDSSEIRETRC